MKGCRLIIIFFLIRSVNVWGQTFTGAGGSIPGNNSYTTFTLAVTGLNPPVLDKSTFGIENVTVNINHPNDADLSIQLVSPAGTTVTLSSNNGGTGNNYTGTVFADTANHSVNNGAAPFTGYFKPADLLQTINDGQNGNGTWQLRIKAINWSNPGNLISWKLTFGNNPAGSVNFSSSNLPLVFLKTFGQSIPSSGKITGSMGIVYNGAGVRNNITDPRNHYNGYAGLELHGQTSASFPQKSYNVETRDALGNAIDFAVLGMPSDNDWVLYGPYDDKTLMRNALTYKLARDMGHWAARTHFCEVFVDSVYQGVYAFMEKIKRDSLRVNIAKTTATDTSGDNVTGGYIFSIDKGTTQWTSSYMPNNASGQTIDYQYVYPKPSNIVLTQANYLQAYVDSFETALYGPNYQDPASGYQKYISVKSFADYFIMNEISRNVDGYRLSSYFHKDKNSKGGLLKAGPVWDYNLAWHNADYCSGGLATGWAYLFNYTCSGDGFLVPFWWEKLITDSTFKNQLHCRWQELRGTLFDTTNIFHLIDSMAAELIEAQVRHFTLYPILGVYTWPNPSPLPDDFPEEISDMKAWIKLRLAWLDAHMPGGSCTTRAMAEFQNREIRIFPNPSGNYFQVIANEPIRSLQLCDELGRKIISSKESTLDVSALENGIYFIAIETSQGRCTQKVIVQH